MARRPRGGLGCRSACCRRGDGCAGLVAEVRSCCLRLPTRSCGCGRGGEPWSSRPSRLVRSLARSLPASSNSPSRRRLQTASGTSSRCSDGPSRDSKPGRGSTNRGDQTNDRAGVLRAYRRRCLKDLLHDHNCCVVVPCALNSQTDRVKALAGVAFLNSTHAANSFRVGTAPWKAATTGPSRTHLCGPTSPEPQDACA